MSNNKMLIDSSHPEETRVAMVRGNRVDEFDFESEHKTQLRGNIYLAKVTRVEPSLQAAFVDYGGNRHGFLAFSEIHPDYYQIPMADRQALLDAEAEDARLEAQAQAIEDDDDAAEEVEAEAQADSDAEKEKAPRKRRSRRRSKKSDEPVDKPVEATADEGVSGDVAETDGSKSDADDASVSEEDDDTPEKMNADNDGDDVVSEPVVIAEEKPKRRRTSRKKVEPSESEAEVSEAEAEPKLKKKRTTSRKKKTDPQETVSEDATVESADEKKPAKRRTTRRKKTETVEEKAGEEAVSETAEAVVDEEKKPAKRRSTRRKKADPATETETSTESDVQQETSDNNSTETAPDTEDSGEEDGKSKRSRGRRRSRGRGRKKNQDDNGGGDDEDDNNGSVEAIGAEDALEEVPTRRSSRRHYKIQEVIKRRQILLVQVVKEERGNKGAALTTYLSLAGRYSVLMPNTARGGGISRKITNASDRKRLKAIAGNLDVPAGMGVILRTAGAARDKAEVQRDFEYLLRLWENVRTLTLESTAPCLTYEEGSLIKRSIRDLYDKDTGEILVAGEAGYREAKDFMAMLMPEHAKNVKLYNDRIPLFAKMGVEAQLDAMLQPQVTLKSGGYLVINQTEALVAIDVNSGRSTRQHSIEETATQTNLEAADEVARQLRLRDLAGLIVIDFIDMEERRNNRNVEKRLKDALKHDRARIQVGRISHFGLMEMSRQRIRASVLESTTQVCPTCDGVGHVRAASSVVLGVLRTIEEQLNKNARNDLTVKVRAPTALYLLNNKRENLSDLETRFRVALTVEIDESIGLEPCEIVRGELAYKPSDTEEAVQPDTIPPQEAAQDSGTQKAQPEQSAEQPSSSDDNGSDGNRPKRRRRRRKRRGEEEDQTDASSDQSQDVTSDAEEGGAEQETAPQEQAAEKKPTRRRRTKKASDEQDDETKVVAEEARSADSERKEKPKRRTSRSAAPKVAAEDNVAETVTEAPADNSTGDNETDSKPKRRTTRRKASEATEPVEAAVGETSEASSDDDQPKKEGWWRRKFF